MNKNLSQLIEMAKSVKMSTDEKQQQRRSFVYGNTKIENEAVTKELVDEVSAGLQVR